jgi:hypothetical protein
MMNGDGMSISEWIFITMAAASRTVKILGSYRAGAIETGWFDLFNSACPCG